jgi:hypothetical protein
MRDTTSPAPATRVLISLAGPIIVYLLVDLLLPQPAGEAGAGLGAPQLAALGVVSWFLGLRWYGLPAMGLRGHRALYAGIGFAVLAWLAFLIARFVTVEIAEYVGSGLGRTFVYLLLFEAFSVQLWLFGVFFRSLADWRGPLTAAVASGVLFGLVAFLAFQESFFPAATALLYFITWGVLYGVIRLRTGGLLGMVVVQSMHSLTSWFLLEPFEPPDLGQLNILYLVSSLLYLVIIWRLWPRREEDYRV